MRLKRLFYVLILLFGGLAPTVASQQNSIHFSTPEDIQEDIKAVSCESKERLEKVKALFIKMGAPADAISVVKQRGVENVVLTKPGKAADEKIILSAHYDKTGSGSCGVVDNWSGIVTIAHIYKTLKDLPLDKTVLIVAFGDEEKGLLGSKAMAGEIKKDDLKQYCAMINVDSLGMNTPQVLSNVSTKKMEALAVELAKKMNLGFQPINLPMASADSAPFAERKIPAATISAIPNEWQTVFHSKGDQVDKVKPQSVYLGYRLALAMLGSVAEKECGAFK